MNATAEFRKQGYPVGCRVMVTYWAPSAFPGLEHGEPSLPIGSKGTVTGVDGVGSLMVDWDNGSRLSITVADRVMRCD